MGKKATADDKEEIDVFKSGTVSIGVSGELIPASFAEVKRRVLVEMKNKLERNFQQNRKVVRPKILKNFSFSPIFRERTCPSAIVQWAA